MRKAFLSIAVLTVQCSPSPPTVTSQHVGVAQSASTHLACATATPGAWVIDAIATSQNLRSASLVMAPDGATHIAFIDARDHNAQYATRSDDNAPFSTEVLPDSDYVTDPTVALGTDGEVLIADSYGMTLNVSRREAGQWKHTHYYDVHTSGNVAYAVEGDTLHVVRDDRRIAEDFYSTVSLSHHWVLSDEWLMSTEREGATVFGRVAPIVRNADKRIHTALWHFERGQLQYLVREEGQSWQREVVDEGGALSNPIALAVDGNAVVHVLYRSNGETRYARREISGTWTREVLDFGVAASPQDLAVTVDGVVHVVYADAAISTPSPSARHAWRELNGVWHNELVTTQTLWSAVMQIALDPAGHPRIAFTLEAPQPTLALATRCD